MIRTNSIGNLGIITVNYQTNNHVIFSATRDNHQKIQNKKLKINDKKHAKI